MASMSKDELGEFSNHLQQRQAKQTAKLVKEKNVAKQVEEQVAQDQQERGLNDAVAAVSSTAVSGELWIVLWMTNGLIEKRPYIDSRSRANVAGRIWENGFILDNQTGPNKGNGLVGEVIAKHAISRLRIFDNEEMASQQAELWKTARDSILRPNDVAVSAPKAVKSKTKSKK